MKAIQVRFIGATNFKGARMKAWVDGGHSVTVPYQYELSDDELRARLVADELIAKLKWDNVVVNGIGSLPNGDWVATLGERI